MSNKLFMMQLKGYWVKRELKIIVLLYSKPEICCARHFYESYLFLKLV